MLGSSKTRPLGRSRPNAGQLALAFNIGSLPRFSRASDLCAAALRSRQVSRDAALKRALGLSKSYQIRQVSSQYRSESLLGRPEMCQIGRMFTFLLMVMRSREQTDAAACGPLRLTKLVQREGFTESSYYMFGPPRAPRATGAQPRSGSVPRAPSRDAAGAFAAEIQLGYPRRQPPPPRPRPLPNDP